MNNYLRFIITKLLLPLILLITNGMAVGGNLPQIRIKSYSFSGGDSICVYYDKMKLHLMKSESMIEINDMPGMFRTGVLSEDLTTEIYDLTDSIIKASHFQPANGEHSITTDCVELKTILDRNVETYKRECEEILCLFQNRSIVPEAFVEANPMLFKNNTDSIKYYEVSSFDFSIVGGWDCMIKNDKGVITIQRIEDSGVGNGILSGIFTEKICEALYEFFVIRKKPVYVNTSPVNPDVRIFIDGIIQTISLDIAGKKIDEIYSPGKIINGYYVRLNPDFDRIANMLKFEMNSYLYNLYQANMLFGKIVPYELHKAKSELYDYRCILKNRFKENLFK